MKPLTWSAVYAWAVLATAALTGPWSPVAGTLRPVDGLAHGQARWGMSPAQVERSNRCRLVPAGGPQKYFSPKPGASSSDYLALRQERAEFLGREASVVYVFHRESLYGYHVFLQGRDEWELDRLLTSRLEELFGGGFLEIDDGGPLRRVWNLPRLIVNYWRYADPYSVFDRTRAGFGVVYRPAEDAVPLSA